MIHIDPDRFRPDFRVEEITLDISEIESLISRMDYESILSDPTLFWQAYCLILSKEELAPNSLFHVKLSGGPLLHIKGKEPILASVKEGVEEIRKLLFKGVLEKRSVSFFTIPIASEIYLKEGNEVIDFTDWADGSGFKIYDQFYQRYICPYLPMLFDTLGATCRELRESKKLNHGYDWPEEMVLNGLAVEWKPENFFTYPIDPIVISEENTIEPKFYEMQQNNVICDTDIVTRDGVIRVHAVIIYAYGNEIMQKILTAGMKESLELKIILNEFPADVVKGFVDYLYLGAHAFTKKVLTEQELDLFELFKLAHLYQILPLINCCTNLISLMAGVEDREKIENLAELYNNEHLKRLGEYFAEDTGTNFIKV